MRAVGRKEVAKRLDGNDCAGEGIPFRYSLLKVDFSGVPGAAAQLGKQTSIMEKINLERGFKMILHAPVIIGSGFRGR